MRNQKKQYAQSQPAPVTKSARPDTTMIMTSLEAGKITPLVAVPLLREDRIASGRYNFQFEMMETPEKLANAVHVTVRAVFVPTLAFERMEGSIDVLNASYGGVPFKTGDAVVPFIEKHEYDRNMEFYKVQGLHARPKQMVNTAYLEAYNCEVNHRYSLISESLADEANGFVRDRLDTTLAVAPWHASDMSHIVPKFDDASMEGEVPLNVASQSLPVTGITRVGGGDAAEAPGFVAATRDDIQINNGGARTLIFANEITAELEENGLTLSLANIEAAKKTAAWAKVRSRFSKTLTDDHIIDILLQGFRVPSQQIDKPILLDQQSTIFGYDRRYATDSGNLDASVTRGLTGVAVNFTMPPTMTGGVILITAEAVPDQLYERKEDHVFTIQGTDGSAFPNHMLDDIDPQKVSVVPNSHVDVQNTDPDATFGYGGLNYQYVRNNVRIGGKYMRPISDDTFSEDRQKIWLNTTANPRLNANFYLATDLQTTVFADQVSDPFEVTGSGQCQIVGNTIFGANLEEATGDYDAIMAEVDLSRIEGDEVT